MGRFGMGGRGEGTVCKWLLRSKPLSRKQAVCPPGGIRCAEKGTLVSLGAHCPVKGVV